MESNLNICLVFYSVFEAFYTYFYTYFVAVGDPNQCSFCLKDKGETFQCTDRSGQLSVGGQDLLLQPWNDTIKHK